MVGIPSRHDLTLCLDFTISGGMGRGVLVHSKKQHVKN